MSKPAKPAWPDLTSLPFTMFGAQGATPANPMAQGLAGGVDAMKNFWGKLPGGTALPGFLVPTLDVEELDKRIADLRAAESWLEVNLNVLRATIQGLEVQRHTIAAIQSLSTMGEGGPTAPAAGGLPAGWPMMSSPPPVSPPPAPEPPAPSPVASGPQSRPEAVAGDDAPAPGAAMVGLAANNWLAFMQDQFTKVANAALAGSAPGAANVAVAKSGAAPRKAAKKATAKRTRRKPAVT